MSKLIFFTTFLAEAKLLITASCEIMSLLEKHLSFPLCDSASNNSHCFGVNAMAWDEENMLLYTGGRDATIRQWNASNKTSLVSLIDLLY